MEILIRNWRIANNFDKVWASIPGEAQEILNERIFLVADNEIFLDHQAAKESRQKVKDKQPPLGITIYALLHYRVVLFKRLYHKKDTMMRGVIAHELAHVYLEHPRKKHEIIQKLSTGESIEEYRRLLPEDIDFQNLNEVDEEITWEFEEEADDLVEHWGFSSYRRLTVRLLDDWSKASISSQT